MTTKTFDSLFDKAVEVCHRAYSPYSRFSVGAALLGTDGRIFTGCNVENLSFGLTVCAERVAVGSAVAAGCRTFEAIVIVADTEQPISPCGACRQVLAEFNPSLEVVAATLGGDKAEFRLDKLLPRAKTGILGP